MDAGLARKSHIVTKMVGSNGEVQTSKAGIVEVFAQFYEALYQAQSLPAAGEGGSACQEQGLATEPFKRE